MIEAGTHYGEGFAVEVAEWAMAVLHNGLGEHAPAAAAAERAYEHDGLGFGVWVLPELVEAAALSGDRSTATSAFERLAERSRTSTTAWARGVEAAAHALIADGREAAELHVEAIDQLAGSRVIVLHARAQLNYGEWLRRENRHVDARTQLRAAHAAFDGMGARGFAERARRELLAMGETAGERADDTRDGLTPQEAQIARLARDRLTNADIAAQLYLSPRTVEYHLRNACSKLGISSERELADALPARERPARARVGAGLTFPDRSHLWPQIGSARRPERASAEGSAVRATEASVGIRSSPGTRDRRLERRDRGDRIMSDSRRDAGAVEQSPQQRQTARIAGWLMALTFVTAIGALILYDPVLNDTGYILGAGDDSRVTLGALLEIFLMIGNVARRS